MPDSPSLSFIERLAGLLQENPWWIVLSGALTLFATAISVMAIPSILQTFFGAPKIRVELDKKGDTLQVLIFSEALASKFLQWAKVYRTPPSVQAHFEIFESNGDTLEKGMVRPKLGTFDELKYIVTIAGWTPACFPVVRQRNGKTYLYPDESRLGLNDDDLLISARRCRIEVEVFYNGRWMIFHAFFDTDNELNWNGAPKMIRKK